MHLNQARTPLKVGRKKKKERTIKNLKNSQVISPQSQKHMLLLFHLEGSINTSSYDFTRKRKVSTPRVMGLHVGVKESGKQCMPSLQQNAVSSNNFIMKH